jgi:hypothetical protein
MAASQLTWRAFFFYMAAFPLTWHAFYPTWRVSGQHEGEKLNGVSEDGCFSRIVKIGRRQQF